MSYRKLIDEATQMLNDRKTAIISEDLGLKDKTVDELKEALYNARLQQHNLKEGTDAFTKNSKVIAQALALIEERQYTADRKTVMVKTAGGIEKPRKEVVKVVNNESEKHDDTEEDKALIKKMVKPSALKDVEESVTNFNPKSQGGTRKELLAKLMQTKNAKDAEAARKAGASQGELSAAMKSTNEAEELEEGRKLYRQEGSLEKWTKDAEAAGHTVVHHKGKTDPNSTHHAINKDGKVVGKFFNATYVNNKRGHLHTESVDLEETIHVGYRNSKGVWIKTSTHNNYRDATKASEELEKSGKKGVQHRYDNKGSIDPGAMMTYTKESEEVDEATNVMQRYGQKIIKRAKAAAAERDDKKEEPKSDLSQISTHDLLQSLRRTPQKKTRAKKEVDESAAAMIAAAAALGKANRHGASKPKASNVPDYSHVMGSYRRGKEDAKAGKPYNNPFELKVELGAAGNYDHNSYREGYYSKNESEELEEAHKIGDTVIMNHPTLKGVKGTIGEIKHGAYKGAPKSYVIDYQHPKHSVGHKSSIQLSSKDFKSHKEGSLGESSIASTLSAMQSVNKKPEVGSTVRVEGGGISSHGKVEKAEKDTILFRHAENNKLYRVPMRYVKK